jgi:hypothetical protein
LNLEKRTPYFYPTFRTPKKNIKLCALIRHFGNRH